MRTMPRRVTAMPHFSVRTRTGGSGHIHGVDVAAAGPELQDDAAVATRRGVVQGGALRQVRRVRQRGARDARQAR